MLQILQDSARYPALFQWNGLLDDSVLRAWLRENNIFVPIDLYFLWCKTGGGSFFETETILGPFGDVAVADDLISVNRYHWSKGVPEGLLVFHVGAFGLSGVIMELSQYVIIHSANHEISARFDTLDEWYLRLIRPEYADRYGLQV